MSGAAWMSVAFLLAMMVGVPVPFAAGIAVAIGLLLADIPMTLMAQSAYTAFEPFPLTTIPLFILAGQLMERGGMSTRLIAIAQRLVGAYKGGLGLVTIVACMFFSALSGSSPATTAAIGSITIPAMLKEKYKPRFAGAVAAAAGALGSMIPPSNLLVIYALVSDTSIPRLFLAGIVPGIVIGLLLIVITYGICKVNDYGGKGEKFSWRPLLEALWDGKWALAAPVIILGGIYGGIFTPSEAAAVAVFYGLFVGTVVYKGLDINGFIESLRFTAIIIGSTLFILAFTKAFGQLVTIYDIPEIAGTAFARLGDNPALVMLLIGALYLFVGMWLESIAQIVIFTAVMLPVAVSLGVDPVLFGIFTVMTCEVGFLTPPIGGNLFIASKLSRVSIEQISIGVLPLLLPYILVIVSLAFFSEWVLFLPDLVFGKSIG